VRAPAEKVDLRMGSKLRILVVGSGGREHALAWKLSQSPRAEKVYCAPGNDGIAQVAGCVAISASDKAALADFAEGERIGLTVVGPEIPLADGIADVFQERGLRVFGPSGRAAVLEGSKIWCKQILSQYGIPSGTFAAFDRAEDALAYVEVQEPPIVVKADGLAAGKGVTVAGTVEEASDAIRAAMIEGVFGDSGRRVMIEEYLAGQEVTVMALSDGENLFPLPASQDHKPVFDGDRGPNTGGMGCYSPVPLMTEDLFGEAMDNIMRPIVSAMGEEGRPYVGCLYGGLILTDEGLKVIEFNCRFGDPEAQAVLPRVEGDLVDLLEAAVDGSLPSPEESAEERAAVCVVMASGGYPGEYETGKLIGGLEAAEAMPDVVVFHAAARKTDEGMVTSGGRVLGVTGMGDALDDAIDTAYRAVDEISFDGAHCRRDIGRRTAGGGKNA
jgi:phosphoribosylamine--glycine ligase